MGGRRLAVVVAVAVFCAFGCPTAGAHAVLVRAEPSDAASLAGAPRHVLLRFSETISSRFRLASLLDAHGHVVAGTRVHDGTDPRTLVLDVPRLRRGTYEVTWEVLAQADGHVTGGALVFGVGVPAGSAPRRAPEAAPPTFEAGLRWLDFALFSFIVGGLALSTMLLRASSAGRVSGDAPPLVARRVLAGAVWSAALALAVGGALLVRQAQGLPTASGQGGAIARLIETRWGGLWLAREVLLAGVLVVVLALRRAAAMRRAPTAGLLVASCLVTGLAAVRSMGGHGAAVEAPVAHVATDALHVVAAALWLGGVAAFAVALRPGAGMPIGQTRALARACRGPFALVAGISVALVAATGLYAAGAQVASVDALLTTAYGRTLMTKSALVLLAVGIGLGNALLLLRARWHNAARLMLVEGGLGLGVLLAAAEMTASSPPRGPEFDAPRAVRAPALAGHVGDVVISATARPNRPGTNVFTVVAVSSRRPPPAAIDGVTLMLSGPDAERTPRAVPLAAIGANRWSGGMRVDEPGRWRMTLALRRGGRRLVAGLGWSVDRPDMARPTVVSARRLGPTLDRAAVLILLALALALAAGAVALVGMRLRRPMDSLRREPT